MRPFILLSSIVSFAVQGLAQCTTVVPADAVVVTGGDAETFTNSGIHYWVCSNASQKIFTGTNNSIAIEADAGVTIDCEGSMVWYRGTTPLVVTGSNNAIHVESFPAVSNQGPGNTVFFCGAGNLVFVYTNAPAGGCLGLGISDHPEGRMMMYPRADLLSIVLESGVVERVAILDAQGRTMITIAGPGSTVQVPIGPLPVGMYTVQVCTSTGTVTRRFVR